MNEDSAKNFPPSRKWLKALKILFTTGLLLVILNQLRNLSISNLIYILNWPIFLIAFLMLVLHNLFGAWRWSTLTRKFPVKTNIIRLLKYYYIGNFVSFFLPTSIGGDVARIILLRRESDSLEIGSSTVIVERVLGLISIIMLFAFSMFFGIAEIITISFLWPLLFFIMIVFFGVWFIFYIPENWLEKLLFFSPRINSKLHNIIQALKAYRKESILMFQGLGVSLLYQLAMIGAYYFLARSINLLIPFQHYLLIMPLVWILSLIPLSLNGLGIREGGFVYLFSLLGYPPDLLSFISILGVVLLIAQGLIGGILFLFDKEERKLINEMKT